MKILLIEPEYYTKYPPLPLLKMATYFKEKGHEVELVKGCNMFAKGDRIYITSLFTYEWKPVWDCVDFYKKSNPKSIITIGGIYTSLLPEHASKAGCKIHQGLVNMLENYVPDYSLCPEWEESIVHSTRGCVRKCEFCGVKTIEPKFTHRNSIKAYVVKKHKKITFFDNNFLANPKWDLIIQELVDFKKPVDFNQGLDIRLLNEEKANFMSQLEIDPVRFAFDSMEYKDQFIKGIEIAQKYELGKKHYIMCYMLYNFHDTPQDLIERLRICCGLKVRVYLMRYAPIDLHEYEYVGEHWTKEKLENVDRLNKIVQAMGTINPASYVYVKFPLLDYVRNLNILWEFDAASTNTAAQRSLFNGNSNS